MNNKEPIVSGKVVSGKVDFVFVHKDRDLLQSFVWLANKHIKKVNIYSDQQQFLSHISRYSKDTKIVLGRTFRDGEQTGIQIAYHLHQLRFKQLYLITFLETPRHEIPDYVIHIPCEYGDGLIRILDE